MQCHIEFHKNSWPEMFFSTPLPFIKDFIEDLDEAIKQYNLQARLSITQRSWLAFCIMALLVTHSLCWSGFERASLGKYSTAGLSWMFCRSKIYWSLLLQMSVLVILRNYGIRAGILALDDTDKRRSKSTKNLAHVHKLKDKATGGFFMGQCIVFLVLITEKITIPVGFAFYEPDPVLSRWNKNEKKLKAQGVPKKERPPKPQRNPSYLTKEQIALHLLEQFKENHAFIKVKCILADALYGTSAFVEKASSMFDSVQVISQLRSNQKIRFQGKKYKLEEYFSKFPGTPQSIKIRGREQQLATIGSARLHVEAHGKKRFVIALKYDGEEHYRFLVASDLSWRTIDIVQAYSFRWLVEVFFQDWKTYEGFGESTKQWSEEGSGRGLILSLLADHCLMLHPTQKARLENKLPAYTVGSLTRQLKLDALVGVIEQILDSDHPQQQLKHLTKRLKTEQFTLNVSKKHMVGRSLGRLEPTPSLKYRAAA